MSLLDHNKQLSLRKGLIIGIGGGGCNVIAGMAESWIDGPDLIAINTDAQALDACPVARKVQIGRSITEGQGAGGDVNLGKLSAEDDADMIRHLVSKADLVCVVVTEGGGTGTGAAPVIARIAREEGALTLGFASMPFEFEGQRRKQYAVEGRNLLQDNVDSLICLPNQRLIELVPDQTSLMDAFRHSDRMLGVGIRGLWNLVSQVGIINVDFSDLRGVFERSGGCCTFGYGDGKGKSKGISAVSDLMQNPLLESGQVLKRANAALLNIVGGPDLTLIEVQKIMTKLQSEIRSGAEITMGATIDESWKDRLVITMFVSDQEADASPYDLGVLPLQEGVGTSVKKRQAADQNNQRAIQGDLNFTMADKGRFKNVEPTVFDGEDIDIPTFIRRGIKISVED